MKIWGRVDQHYYEGDPEKFFGREELRRPEYRITPSLHAPFCPLDPTEAMVARRDRLLNFFFDHAK